MAFALFRLYPASLTRSFYFHAPLSLGWRLYYWHPPPLAKFLQQRFHLVKICTVLNPFFLNLFFAKNEPILYIKYFFQTNRFYTSILFFYALFNTAVQKLSYWLFQLYRNTITDYYLFYSNLYFTRFCDTLWDYYDTLWNKCQYMQKLSQFIFLFLCISIFDDRFEKSTSIISCFPSPDIFRQRKFLFHITEIYLCTEWPLISR